MSMGSDHYGERVALIGWGDESGSDAVRDPGTYVLSVVLADPSSTAEVRATMVDLREKGPKLHWRDLLPKRRMDVQTMTSLPAAGLVVVRSRPELAERPERRRRLCLEHLLPTVANRGCPHLVLESRGPADDHRDREMLDAMRRKHQLPRGFHLDHIPGPQEPALWAADALCGAVVSDRVKDPHEGDYLAVLQGSLTIEVIEV
jgi:hypothetical protein